MRKRDNAPAAGEVDRRLIAGQRVDPAPTDKEQLVPTLAVAAPAVGPVGEVLIDSGFVSEEAVRALEEGGAGPAHRSQSAGRRPPREARTQRGATGEKKTTRQSPRRTRLLPSAGRIAWRHKAGRAR